MSIWQHARRTPVRVVAAAAAAVALGTAAVAAAATSGATPAAKHGLTALSGTWKVLSSATATQGGAQISTPGFGTGGWLTVQPDDAGAPGTEINALLQNGKCPNVFFATNMKSCFGTGHNGPITSGQFSVPWWFRTDFTASVQSGQTASLIVNGVVGAADVWVNGSEVATKSTVTGAYTRFTFDVTGHLRSGTNSVALELYPNNPKSMLTLDDVDWNQIPPDNNTGIQFPVQLQIAGPLGASNAHVVEANASDLSSSALTVKVDVTNSSGSSQTGTVNATIVPPGGGTPISVQQPATVSAHSTRTVTFTPSAFPSLTIASPKVWWPYQMGSSPLYTLNTSVAQGSTVLDTTTGTFGIRNVTSALVGKSSVAPSGVRQYSVNGRKVVMRGGGFAPDLFLRYSSEDTARQLALLKNLGLNMIRLEGHFMPEDFYRQADAAGMMIDAGYQCCDFWEQSSPSSTTLNLMTLSAKTIAQNERNHPSVVTFSWSDNAPGSAQESATLAAFGQADFTVPVVASAEYKSSPKLGPSGEKEGPYDWVPPSYWYDTTHAAGGDQTNAGGSWGFDSEESAGDTVPTLDSIKRFMSSSDQANLWQNPSFNQYHLNYENGHGGYSFGQLFVFDQALNKRYGKWSDLNGYVAEAQLANYENTRAQFEAFLHHSTNTTPSTGTIYWQVNKGWPSLLWTLYNQDGDQAGSFFGAKKANETLHVLYGYDNNTVTLDNVGKGTQAGLTVEAKVYDLAGKVLDDQTVTGLSVSSQSIKTKVITPKVPAATTPPTAAKVSFVELLLSKGGTVVDRNVYWISSQKDVVNWGSTLGNPQATMSQYANLSALHSLPTGSVKVTTNTAAKAGPAGADTVTTVTVTNTASTPTVAFFLRADVRRGSGSTPASGDNQVTSALWSDNDITLWPGESQTLTVTYDSADLHGASPVISLSGWNVNGVTVAG
jgi:exo-1,4-beta-D-glucosaminidase